MKEETPLVNRVAGSGLITINLEDFFPKGEVVAFDLKDYLYMELMLKEKEFRASLKEHNWEAYQDKHVAIFCSTDAIVPVWAFMLVAAYATPFASSVFQGSPEGFYDMAFHQQLLSIKGEDYEGKRVVIKGCSNKPVPVSAYVGLTQILRPFAQSVMYGEPCSTVPIFKRPRKPKA